MEDNAWKRFRESVAYARLLQSQQATQTTHLTPTDRLRVHVDDVMSRVTQQRDGSTGSQTAWEPNNVPEFSSTLELDARDRDRERERSVSRPPPQQQPLNSARGSRLQQQDTDPQRGSPKQHRHSPKEQRCSPQVKRSSVLHSGYLQLPSPGATTAISVASVTIRQSPPSPLVGPQMPPLPGAAL